MPADELDPTSGRARSRDGDFAPDETAHFRDDPATGVIPLSPFAIFVWLLNVAVDTVGHMAFKSAALTEHETEFGRWKEMFSNAQIWIGIVCFTLEFCLWLVLLSVLPLSLGVLLGAINMVAIVLAGRLIFKERLDPMRVAGLAFITFGVALVGAYA